LAVWMRPFAPYFTAAVWRHVLVLVALQLPTSFPVASMACWLPSRACPFVLSRLNVLHFE
jgi:hypothetical protein